MADNTTKTPSVMGETNEPVVTTQPVASVEPTDPPTVPEIEKTLKTLQQEAIALGFPETAAKGLMTKAAAQAVIDSLSTPKDVPTPPTKVEKVKTLEETPNPKEEKHIAEQHMTKKDIMRNKLESQPQVPIFIQKTDTEQAGVVKIVKNKQGKNEYVHLGGAAHYFTLNGYTVIVPKGVQTMVPLQVFNMWSESMQLTQQAGSQFSVDRIDPETGRAVSTRL